MNIVASMKFGSGSSGRVKDSRASWLFVGVTGCVLSYAEGLFDTVGILVVVFVEHFNETNAKIGGCIITAFLGSLRSARLRLDDAVSKQADLLAL